VIDLHFHALPGIDDGPPTIEDSITLVRAAATAGTSTIVATPHVSWRYQNQAETIIDLARELEERLKDEGVPVEIRPGAEIAMTRAGDIDRAELPRLGIGGGPWLLLEPPFTPLVTGLDSVVLGLQSDGYRILLAHPERCPAFHSDPELLRSLVRAGVLTSVTAGSLVGRFGGEVRRFALNMVAEELVHNVASDAHDEVRRPPGIAAELERSGLSPLTDWLTLDVPEAILNGASIPPRPAFTIPRIERRPRFGWPHVRRR
jgi:protein-tyrosine phosphatase